VYFDSFRAYFCKATGCTVESTTTAVKGCSSRRVLQSILAFGLMAAWIPAQAAIPGVKSIQVRSASSTSNEIIQLAEVIARRSSNGTDVATSSRGASASANSTYANNPSRYGPAKSIDGASSAGIDSQQNYYHSGTSSGQVLTITLANAETLSSLTLVGRSDCCSSRDVYDVTLLNASGGTLASYNSLNANNGSHSVTTQLSAPSNATEGQWGPVLNWPLVSVSMANLPDGRILSYSGSERRTWPTTERTFSVVWDPSTGNFDETLHVGHNMFCAATSMTHDGEVFVNGGRNQSNSPWTSTFDYQTGTWTQIENMASGGRWYPTTLALGNGDIFTGMGIATNVRNPDIWNPDTGWRVLNGIDFISLRQRRNQNGRENVFPLLSLAPSGSIYHFWDTTENHFLSANGNGSATVANANTDSNNHAGGIQVMYDEGKLLISGQNDGSWGGNGSVITDNAFTVDLNGTVPVIRSSGDMTSARKFHQMIPFPTGEVLVVGGNTTGVKFADSGSVMHAEIWNPQTRQFRQVASMSVPRDYHSTALLMTDGRVITAGGGYHPNDANSSGTHQDAQIYSPPYLFNANNQLATRPTLNSSVNSVGHGEEFLVSTTGNIDYFSLIKMSATSHAINTDVRQFRPEFSASGTNQYLISMHDNENVATPGYWMLFAVNTSGVPSVADVIKVELDSGNNNGGNPPVVNPIAASAAQVGSNVTYSVNATGGTLLYSWNFGDGSGDTALSLSNSRSHTYSSPGRYVVTVTVRNQFGDETTESFTQMVHRPLTAGKPVASSGLVELTSRNEIYVVNPDNNSVSVLSTGALARISQITVGDEPRALALAPDGRVWVVNKADATVSVINPSSRQVVQTITLDRGSLPHGIVMGNNSAYIALQGDLPVRRRVISP